VKGPKRRGENPLPPPKNCEGARLGSAANPSEKRTGFVGGKSSLVIFFRINGEWEFRGQSQDVEEKNEQQTERKAHNLRQD